MSNVNVYLKCNRNVEVQVPDAFLSDLGQLRCSDNTIAAKLKAIKVHHFEKNGAKRCVISTLHMVELMEKVCSNITVDIVGETDVLLEWVDVNKHKSWQQWLKAIMVCLVCFFGTAFTIMAYHNEIEIHKVFTQVYTMVMNKEPGGINILELSYSIGLGVGIVAFFNHIGGRRLTKDPTPIEVAMRNYEEDVDKALIATAEREGKEIN